MKFLLTLLVFLTFCMPAVSAEITKAYHPSEKAWEVSSMSPYPQIFTNHKDPAQTVFVAYTLWKVVKDSPPWESAFAFSVNVVGKLPVIACSVDQSLDIVINESKTVTYSLFYNNRNKPAYAFGDNNMLIQKITASLDKNNVIVDDILKANSIDIIVYFTNCNAEPVRISTETLKEWKELILWVPKKQSANPE